MFGANKPFGSTTAFGQSSFGTTTPFGQSSTAFGAKPATSNVFGTSSFGTTPNTGGLFGASTQQTGTGLFGQPTSTFGAPASTSTGTFGFGGTSTSGSLFGNAAPATQSSGGLFGSTTSAFGTPRLPFGGFSTSTGTGLFGQNTSTAGTGLFGSTGGFTATAPTGTTIKFNPPSGTDTMMKGGVSTSIGTKHQCITCMKEYENKSLEELRVEDYAANRKGGGAAGMTFGANTQQTGLFGATPAAASTSGFSFGNTTQSKPLFGTTGTTNAFGGSTSLFGQPAQTQNTGLFGKSVGFGTATTSAAPAFNFGGTGTMGTGTSLFGQNNQPKPLFGQTTTSTGLFGNPASTQATGFGTNTGFGAFGATNQQSTGLFGAKPTGFGTTNTTTTNSFSFGNTNQIGGGLFGSKPAAPAFGNAAFGTQSTGFGAFGQTSTAGTGLFGQTKPTTSVFGNTGSTFGSGLGSSFGTSTFPTMGALGTNTGTGFFGSTTANKAPGFNFGSTGSTGFNFGPNTNSSSFNFNPSSSILAGSDPGNAAALQQAQQQILAMTANPFGDSPLFRNPIKDTPRQSEVLKPTNPSAQKALLNDNQYKVALLPTAKIKPKPWSPSPTGKTFLFDGLEDEEPSLGMAFVPKRSIKKLVLKNLGTNRSTVTLTSDITNNSSQNTRIDVSISLNKGRSSQIFTDSPPPAVPLTVDDTHDVNANKIPSECDVVSSSDSIKSTIYSKSLSEERLRNIPERSIGHVNSSMDDSIAALHTNKQNVRGRTFNIISESEDDATDKEQSVDDTWTANSPSKDDGASGATNKTGIILTRPEYYTIPQMDFLETLVDENGDCFVENFAVGREGYGLVTFPGRINVAGLNLDEIVHFRKKEINVYPDDNKKPSIGEELNRQAVVTLEKVWPTDKTNHSPIKDSERLMKLGYREKIEKSTSRLGAKFIDYVPETGSWTFQVNHFSKYGLEDSDEEMDVSKPPETDKAKIPPQQGQLMLSSQDPSSDATQKKLLKRKPISAATSGDENMLDAQFSPEMNKDYFMNDNGFFHEVFSPSRPLFSTHIDAERIQGMKASFFHQDMEEDWTPYQFKPEDNFAQRKDSDMKPYISSLNASKLNESMTSLNKKQRYHDYEADQTYMSPVPTAKVTESGINRSMSSLSLSAKQNEWISSLPLVKTVPEKSSYIERQVPALNKIKLKPLKKSVLYDKYHLLADAGYFMGCSFRPGWRFDGSIVVVQPPTDSDNFSECLPSFFLYGDSKSISNKGIKSSGFTLALEKITANSIEDEKFMQKNLIEALELQLKHSVSAIENDTPLFIPKPGVDLIHAHAELFEKHLKDSNVLHHDGHFTKQSVDVWNLLVSLWGRVRELSDNQSASKYEIQMARRGALSQWLIKTSETTVMKEIARLNHDKYLSKIFLYLSCRRIYDAVKLAQQHKDFRLSLLLSQAEGTTIVRKWICNELYNWEQNGAYKFINYERILLYAVLAGLLIWENVYETVNCCKNLDWKQALALHLWYHCEANASIQDAVEEYDKSFKGLDENNRKYALPPYPSYISLLDKDLFDSEEDGEVVYDTCYHLLKLYCNRAHRLSQLLIPQTYTTDHLDYRLSWLLHLALSSVGYNISTDIASTLHVNFASQLESIDMWHWAIFVSLHHPDVEWRTKSVKDILLRHVSLDHTKENEEQEKFIKSSLLVPEKWIYEAKAIKAHSLGKHPEEAWFLLKAGSWNKSHSIVIKYLASDAVINEDYDYLLKYLNELAMPERSSTIIDWSSGGQVYLDYINMCQVVQGVLSMETSAYDLANFTPEVLSLCNRLSSIPTPTIKDRLSVAEMAKKTATIMRSIAMLQARKTKDDNSLIVLASYLKNLPMPHDYAVSENRFIANSFLKEVTSEMQATY